MSIFGFGFGAPVMGPMAGFGANNGRVMQSRGRPSYAPGAVQSQSMMMPGQGEDVDELLAMLEAQSRGQNRFPAAMHAQPGPMPPQAPVPAQQMPASPIQAPKDRGMFGRFAGILAGKPYGEAQMGWVERLGRGPAGMNAVRDEIRAGKKAAEEEARRQQMLQQLSEMPGVTDQQRMLLGMGLGVDQITNQAFAPPSAPKYGLELTEVTDPVTGETRFVQTSEAGGVRPVEGFVPVQQERTYSSAQDATGVRRYTEGPDIGQPVPGFETPRAERGGMQVGVDANGNPVITFGSGLATETAKVPPGYVRRQNPDGSTYLEPEPGSPAATEAQGAATAKTSLDNTFKNIMLSYLDLQEMGAIRDVEKGPLENVGAFVRSSPVGRFAGKVTGSQAESLRETIEALQPAITQAIMSQPGMSARSMDSQRELEFFMKSITTPTADVWANFATLHALDLRFGSGQLMASMLQAGQITPADFAKITRSPKVNSVINQVEQKVNELFVTPGGGGMSGLPQSAIDDGITPEEWAMMREEEKLLWLEE